jgi:sugar phosphate isomerase/epimerase
MKSPAKYPIGLELYSVREALAKDLVGTLREVARIGYEVVEFYAPYFEWTVPYAKEVRRQMDDLGLRCHSTHNHVEAFAPGEGIGKAIELNQVIGARHLILASAGREGRTLDTWKKLCDQLTTAVGQLQPHGLTAGFHNHQTEWAKIDGDKRIMDAWIKANPGRIKSLHLKDWAPGAASEEKGYRVLFGEGVCPWTEVIAAAESVGGLEFYLMEQEGSRFSEFETAQRCLDNWRKLTRKS